MKNIIMKMLIFFVSTSHDLSRNIMFMSTIFGRKMKKENIKYPAIGYVLNLPNSGTHMRPLMSYDLL